MRWTDRETLKLIALYKENKLLWDRTSPMYNTWFARLEAYASIVRQMNKPGLTSKEVRMKIKNLRSSFHFELRRMATSAQDMTTKKQAWFEAIRPLILQQRVCKRYVLQSSEGNFILENELADEEESMQAVKVKVENDDEHENESPVNVEPYVVSTSKEYLEGVSKDRHNLSVEFEECLENSEHYQLIVPRQQQQTTAPSLLQTHRQLSPETQVETEIQYLPYDQFYIFSKKLAAKLRRLPLDRALILQVEIQSLLAKERIRLLEKSITESKQNVQS